MAQAAYCSQCGANVYVGHDGRCPQGHGPESLSGHYEVPEPGAAPPVATGTAPQKSKTLVIVLVILGVLLLCTLGSCCAAIPLYTTITEEVTNQIERELQNEWNLEEDWELGDPIDEEPGF